MKYQCPERCEGVTLLDVFYVADENGVVDIPNIPHNLENSGFVPFSDKKPSRKVAVDKENTEKTENV